MSPAPLFLKSVGEALDRATDMLKGCRGNLPVAGALA